MVKQEIIKQKSTAKIGLVLSGGGVKVAAHLGLLQALEELDIQIDSISGSSGGAVVGAFYAAGYNPLEVLEISKNAPSWFNIKIFGKKNIGLVDNLHFIPYFKKYLPENSFEKLQRQLFITATNLDQGYAKVFSQGEIVLPMVASSAIPMWFPPVKIANSHYADAGIMDNFPIAPLLDNCDKIIGSYLGSNSDGGFKNSKKSMISRTLHLSRLAIERHKFQFCDYLFQPNSIRQISTLNPKHFDKAFDLGYKTAMQNRHQILKALGLANAQSFSISKELKIAAA